MAATAPPYDPTNVAAEELPRTRWWRRTARNRSIWLGGVLIAVLAIVALLAPVLAPYDPTKLAAGKRLSPPSWEHAFGTDEFGRDIFSRVIHGTQLTLYVGVVAVGIGLLAGAAIGIGAGYAGGWVQAVLMRGVDFLYTFPDILIALGLVAFLGPSLTNAMVAVGISVVPYYARVTYSVVLVERNKPYFEAATAIGAGWPRLVVRHLLPNIVPPLIVVATLGFSAAVLSAAALSFLGLGAQPPAPEWGKMLADGRNYIARAPWILVFPGLAIVVTVLGFNILGDGIRDVLDPRQRREVR
ncbi:MAG: ABC transporter permease [Alphaproteobacteria bacterium]|nr:ABC transporter permease [Alphaproteobacteria bacterium]